MTFQVDFLLVGCPKCGTTWVFDCLDSHPDIFVPKIKDLYFFDENYDRGFNWYSKFFKCDYNIKTIGELSHNYLYDETALKRIKQHNPETKIIVSLREPISRSISQYYFMKKDGLIGNDIFAGIKKWEKFIVDWSCYSKYIKVLLKYFSPKNIHYILVEDIKQYPDKCAMDLYTFLSVDSTHKFQRSGQKSLARTEGRSRVLSLSVKYTSMMIRKLGFLELLSFFKHNKYIRDIIYKTAEEDIVEINFLKEHLYSCFIDETTKLEKLTGLDLERWKKVL